MPHPPTGVSIITQQALLPISDKTDIVDFVRALHERGVKPLPTGGTAKLLIESSLPVTEVADYTGFLEIPDGRVKTLYPKMHDGISARRDLPEHTAALSEHSIPTIDLLVMNLYPFQWTVAKDKCLLADAIENIDIGGPAMLRSAAKNHRDVTVIVDPADYTTMLVEMQANSSTVGYEINFMLAKKVFTHTTQHDGAITNYLTSLGADKSHSMRSAYPQTLNLAFDKMQEMRYGENPHQPAVFYRDLKAVDGALASYKQPQGKELSYNDIADANAVWKCVKLLDTAHGAVRAIIKHANPCGVAIDGIAQEAYEKAFKTDSTSAFGGIIAFNVSLDKAAVQVVAKQFVEVLIAPGFSEGIRAVFTAKQDVRVLEIPLGKGVNAYGFKRAGGGLLVQSLDTKNVQPSELYMATKRYPTPKEMDDPMFVWRVAKFVKSSVIAFCGGGMTLGVGAGQMSCADPACIASIKAQSVGLMLTDSAVASDAPFPFRDGLDVVADIGASCVIQPGGSVCDGEVIAAANERNVAMIFMGTRHFRC